MSLPAEALPSSPSLDASLDAVLRGLANGVTAQDSTGRLVYANDAAARICGFDTAAQMLAAALPDI
ncbi:MAG: PAS domain-containing protein, partial [Myxococcales bacterium]